MLKLLSDYFKYRHKNLEKLSYILTIVIFIIFISHYVFDIELSKLFITKDDPSGLKAVAYLLIASLVGYALTAYVRGSTYEKIKAETSKLSFPTILAIVRNEIAKRLETEPLKISKEMNEKIDEKITSFTLDSFLSHFTDLERHDIIELSKLKHLGKEFESVKDNIVEQKLSAGRSGNVNLFLGFVTTVIAIGVLYVTLNQGPNTMYQNGFSYVMHILPRITLSILIQVFAFFFLKLYKSNFDDVKYYNNELTNINMKIVALKSAILFNETSLDGVIKDFSETERNFILKKNETTVELQKNIIEGNSSKNIIDAISKIMPTYRGNS